MPQAFLESRRQYTKDKVNEYFEILMRKIFIQYIEDEFDVTISFLYCLLLSKNMKMLGAKDAIRIVLFIFFLQLPL